MKKINIPYPEHTIRISKRARKFWLKISPSRGLEIVVPRRFSHSHLNKFLEEKKDWIERHLESALSERERLRAEQERIPDKIELPLLDRTLQVVQIVHQDQRFRIRMNDHYLFLHVPSENHEEALPVLRKWLKRKAKREFPPRVKQISSETGLSFQKITIRGQKTLWGSCSGKKNLSLNFNLLFLPERLFRYVIIHELCHTVHMNHSKTFWKLVEGYIPEWKLQRKELKEAWKNLPAWTRR